MMIMMNALRYIRKLGINVSRIDKEAYPEMYLEMYGEEAVENRNFYNIGAGNFRHPAWTNVDHKSGWYKKLQCKSVGINWDLLALTPIEVESNSAEVVYSSHTIEHITDQAALNMFKESYRILKENGIFRLTMPNIDLHYRAYKANDKYYFYWVKDYKTAKRYKKIMLNQPLHTAAIQQVFLWTFASSASTLHSDGSKHRLTDTDIDRVFKEKKMKEALDYCCSNCELEIQNKYPGNHINWWNEEKTTKMLREAGFETIYRSGYGQSVTPALRNTLLFDNTHPKISLYIEAVK